MEKHDNNLEVMKRYGFNYDYDRNCFIKEGYGALITNLTFKDALQLKKYVLSSPMYLSLLNGGYELISGPAAPDVNGIVYDNSAIYCKNYMDVDLKNSRYELTNEDIDTLISSVDMWARSFHFLVNGGIDNEQKLTDLDVIGKSFKHIIDDLKRDYSYGDLYTIVKVLDEFYEDNSVEGKLYVESNVIQPLKEYIYQHVVDIERLTLDEKQERDIKVVSFVEEVNKIAEYYKDVPMCSIREKMYDYSRETLIHINESNCVVADIIDRINSELSAREVNCIVSELRKSYRERPLITKIRIANGINDNIVDRTIDEYYGKKTKMGVKQIYKK